MTQEVPSLAAFAPPTREQWLALVEKDLKGAPFEKRLVTQLIEGLTVQPLYTSDDAPAPDALGLPGQAPFVRGSAALRSGGAGWSIVPEHRHPLPDEANRAILSDIRRGADGVVVRLSPRLLDQASPACGSGCGCGGGVLIDSVDDLNRLLADVDLAKIQLTVHAGPAFMAGAAEVLALYARRKVADADVRCNLGADPLGTLAMRGSLPKAAETMLSDLGSLALSVSKKYPSARAVSVSTAAYDNAGATAVQELAAALSTAVAYLRAMEDAGLNVPAAARQLTFSLAVGADQFLEIAKFRAFRALYNRVLEAAEVPENQRSMFLHARTSRRILTQRDPWVNVLRTTIGCFAAGVGGADQITVLPFDDVIGLPDEMATRLARNTQIILQEEGHLGSVLDAAGGSYYVEHLTMDLAQAAWKLFQDLERRGGMLAVLRDGSFAKEIEATRQKRSKDLARRKTPITGVSEFPHLGEKPVVRTPVDTSAHQAKLLDQRNQRAKDAGLTAVITTARAQAPEARLGALVEAAAKGATLFALHNGAGAAEAPKETVTPLHLHRFAEPFEKLRDQSDKVRDERGQRPRIFSANMGPIAMHTARAMYAQNFFEAGGFEVLSNDGFTEVASAAEAFAKSGTKTVILCSSDAWYDASACDLARALKEKGAQQIILAGNPGQNEAKYREAGIVRFIFMGCDVLATLTELAQTVLSANKSESKAS
ncbi:MAG: methylmalonyl-CoA mutase family protein [Myxococcales bacterium]